MRVGIIPCRYDSTRFPGKPLALIHGKPMIQWVHEAAKHADLDWVYVATDSREIANACLDIEGCFCVMTDKAVSGSDRCYKACKILNLKYDDIVINIQGDEPCITKEAINTVIAEVEEGVPCATLSYDTNFTDASNPDIAKVVVGDDGYALYFSRLPIPYCSGVGSFQAHVGIYGYRFGVLEDFVELGESQVERCESLEQLRLIEGGIGVRVVNTQYRGIGVDRPSDIILVESVLAKESPSYGGGG